MKTVLTIASDLLREAASRKWFLALGVAITLIFGTLQPGPAAGAVG